MEDNQSSDFDDFENIPEESLFKSTGDLGLRGTLQKNSIEISFKPKEPKAELKLNKPLKKDTVFFGKLVSSVANSKLVEIQQKLRVQVVTRIYNQVKDGPYDYEFAAINNYDNLPKIIPLSQIGIDHTDNCKHSSFYQHVSE